MANLHTRIQKAQIKRITGKRLLNGVITHIQININELYTKQEVIDIINNGENVYVDSTIVKVVDNKYLRTDPNNILEDNLENIKEI